MKSWARVGGAVGVGALLAGVAIPHSAQEAAAEQTTIVVDVTVEDSFYRPFGQHVFVAPDGQTALLAIVRSVDDGTLFGSAEIEGFQVFDLNNPGQSERVRIFPIPAIEGAESVVFFSDDGGLAYVRNQENNVELQVINLRTLTLDDPVRVFTNSPFTAFSPNAEFLSETVRGWDPPFELNVYDTATNQMVATGQAVQGAQFFSSTGEALFASAPVGIQSLTLKGSGTWVDIPLGGAARPLSFLGDSPSGDYLVVQLGTFSDVSENPGDVVVVSPRSGETLYRFSPGDFVFSGTLVGFSPDERFVIFRERKNINSDDLEYTIVELATGDVRQWSDPRLSRVWLESVLLTTQQGQSVLFSALTRKALNVDWDTLDILGEQELFPPVADTTQSELVAYLPESSEAMVLWTAVDYTNWDEGDFPDVPPSGTIATRFVVERISLDSDASAATLAIPGRFIGFDDSGSKAVVWRSDGPELLLDVWDLESNTRQSSVPFYREEWGLSSTGDQLVTPESFDPFNVQPRVANKPLMVSANADTVYLVGRLDSGGNLGVGSAGVFAVATDTGQITEVGTVIGQPYGYFLAPNKRSVMVLTGQGDIRPDGTVSLTVWEVDLRSGESTQVTTVLALDATDGIFSQSGDGSFVFATYYAASRFDPQGGSPTSSLISRSLDPAEALMSADGAIVAIISRAIEYPDTGGEIYLGGALYGAGFDTSESGTGEALLPEILTWGPDSPAVGTFSASGDVFYLLKSNELMTFTGSSFTPESSTTVSLSIPNIFRPTVMIPDRHSERLWVGAGSTSWGGAEAFYAVELSPTSGGTTGAQDVAAAVLNQLTGFPTWVYPLGILVVAVGVMAAWWYAGRQTPLVSRGGGES